MLRKILSSKHLSRLDNIKQWQEKDVFKEESISQHSYKVATYCRILLEDVFGYSESIEILKFKLDCNDRAIFHDWDEALILRDISHETKYNKYNGEEIRRAIDNLAKHLSNVEFEELDDSQNRTPSSNLLINSITSPDEDVKLFVKLCDWLALVHFVKREQMLGNGNLYDQYETAVNGAKNVIPSVSEMLVRRFGKFKVNTFELDNFFYK